MITYTYLCDDCKTEFNIEQSIKEPARAVCINCGAITEHRLITGGNFILKGSCWARDQYSTELRHQIKNLPTVDEEE